MEIRELRYFVAVAEELHFGRAAERLGIAQPPLSRAIRQLEVRLASALFTRSSRGVALTTAGEVLLRESRVVLDAMDAAERRTVRAAQERAAPGLILGTKAGASMALMSELLDVFAAQPDAVPVDVRLSGIGEQGQMLRDGRVDAALLHLPFNEVTGLDTVELAREGQVVLLPAGHPLALREDVTMADVADIPGLPRPRWPGPDGTVPEGPGPVVRDNAQLQALIALGRASWFAPESCRDGRSDLAAVPISDAEPVTTVLAWPAHSVSDPLAALVRTAAGLRGAPIGAV